MQQIGAPLRNGSYTRTNGAPSHEVWPRFHLEAVLDPLATERAGREIYRDEERVEINIPGNPYSKPVHVVTDEDRQQWPEEYAKFKKGMEVAVSGTPLEVWSILKPSMVKELKSLDIMTVEHVANLNEHAIQRIPMYGRKLKELAKIYIDDAERLSFATQAQAENERLHGEIAGLKLQIQNLQMQFQTAWAQQQAHLNAPNPLAVHVPASADPFEAMKVEAPPQPAQSAFEGLPDLPPRRRGRPPSNQEPPTAA